MRKAAPVLFWFLSALAVGMIPVAYIAHKYESQTITVEPENYPIDAKGGDIVPIAFRIHNSGLFRREVVGFTQC